MVIRFSLVIAKILLRHSVVRVSYKASLATASLVVAVESERE